LDLKFSQIGIFFKFEKKAFQYFSKVAQKCSYQLFHYSIQTSTFKNENNSIESFKLFGIQNPQKRLISPSNHALNQS
jgi:hypothetical protein